MISAFGVEHSVVSKGANAGGLHRYVGGVLRAGEKSMQHRGGAGYFNPSPEQVAASKARRAKQAADRAARIANKENAPKFGGTAHGWREHRRASGNMLEIMTPIAATSAGTGYLLNRRTKVSKVDKERVKNEALGATAGGTAGIVGFGVGGQAVKAGLKERRAKRGVTPKERRIWREHVNANPAIKGPLSGRWKGYVNYPKELPDWRIHRALAVKNHPVTGPAVIGATAVGGALYARNRSKKAGH